MQGMAFIMWRSLQGGTAETITRDKVATKVDHRAESGNRRALAITGNAGASLPDHGGADGSVSATQRGCLRLECACAWQAATRTITPRRLPIAVIRKASPSS